MVSIPHDVFRLILSFKDPRYELAREGTLKICGTYLYYRKDLRLMIHGPSYIMYDTGGPLGDGLHCILYKDTSHKYGKELTIGLSMFKCEHAYEWGGRPFGKDKRFLYELWLDARPWLW